MARTITITVEQINALRSALSDARGIALVYSMNCELFGARNTAEEMKEKGKEFGALSSLLFDLTYDATHPAFADYPSLMTGTEDNGTSIPF